MRLTSHSSRWFVIALAVCCAIAPRALAQPCTPEWQAFDPSTASYAGANGTVYAAIMWDPDGAGPITPKVVFAGSFTLIGTLATNGVAAYDPTTGEWSAFGSGIDVDTTSNSYVRALAVLPNGDLIAGGNFFTAGGALAPDIARWDGTAWSPVGTGMSLGAHVDSLLTLPNGDLIAGGQFVTAGDVPAMNIARWNGSTWSALDSGLGSVTGDSVMALAALPNGDLIAGGRFTNAGSPSINNIARWNGSAWSALANGLDGSVASLAVLPNGDLLAGGLFTHAGSTLTRGVARWNGSTWSALGTGVADPTAVRSLALLPSGDVLVGGEFTSAGGASANRIARWNGTQWSPVEDGIGGVFRLESTSGTLAVWILLPLPTGDLIAGGSFTAAGGRPASAIARWDGAQWSAFGTGLNHDVHAIARLSNGDLVIGGRFSLVGGVVARGAARWNGLAWSDLGIGAFDGGYDVRALAVLPDGNLIAGGWFGGVAGAPTHIALWNGSYWSSLGAGIDGAVHALTVLPNGDLVAGGDFTIAGGAPANRIARWDGENWSPLGTGIVSSSALSPTVRGLATLPNGDVIAAGQFTTAGGVPAKNIARWDGSVWTPLGLGTNRIVNALAALPNGDVVAGGWFSTAGGVQVNNIARWNGTAWSPLGSGLEGSVTCLATFPNGDIAAGSGPLQGSRPGRVARWDGSVWAPFGTGIGGVAYGSSVVGALTTLPNGDVIAGGSFFTAGSVVAPYIARWGCPHPLCVADVDDGSGTGHPDGGVTIDDLLYYLFIFTDGNIAADIDDGSGTGTRDGGVTIDDLLYFVLRFTAGC